MSFTNAVILSGLAPQLDAAPTRPTYAEQEEEFVSIPQLTAAWKVCCDAREDKDVVHNFFKGPKFFLTYSGINFCTGRCTRTGQYDFLLPVQHLAFMQQQLQNELGFPLPGAQELDPPLIPAQFTDLQKMPIRAPADFWKELKILQKLNRQSKQQGELTTALQVLRAAQQLVQQRLPPVVFLSIDLEWWEDDHSKVLELGWSVWNTMTLQHATRHFIVHENLYTRNRKYVPDHKDYFDFGTSSVALLAECVTALQADMDRPSIGGSGGQAGDGAQLVLVGHGLRQDLEQLANLGVRLPPGAAIFDTQDLHWARTAQAGAQQRRSISLKALLQELGLRPRFLHNAGNDARWTMEAFLGLLAE